MQKQTQKMIWVILAMAAACGGAATTAGSPTADAGPDQAVASGALVALDGSASSGLSLQFVWAQTLGPSVALSASNAKAATFSAPAVAAGQPPVALEFTLVVSNANGTSAPATVAVTVSPALPANQAPAANAGSNQAVASGGAVVLDGSASAGAVSFSWTQTSGPAVTLSSANTARATFTAPVVSGSAPVTLGFSLVVANAQGNSSSGSMTVTVNPLGANFPPPPGTPPPAPPNPAPLPVGGNGSNRFEVGAANGLYLQDPTPGEPAVQGFVNVTLGAAGGGLPGNAPADTVVTMNGVPLLRDPNLNGNFWRVDPNGPQPTIGSGGQMVLVATGTDPKTGKAIQRQLVMECPKDITVTSTPDIGVSLAVSPTVTITSPSNITFNVGVPIVASIFPQATLFGYNRATRILAPSGSPHNIGPGPLSITVPVLPTAADAYLLDLRWPGVFILDGQTGGFCGLAKRWTYAK